MRLHRASAEGSAITRVLVDMFAPKARGTVVGIPAAGYTRAALLTDKVFDVTNKAFHRLLCEYKYPAFSFQETFSGEL